MSALVPRPGILDIALYVGGESAIEGRAEAMKLASNESALGPSPKAVAAYQAAAAGMQRYPEGTCRDLRTAIGKRHGLDPARIVCGAGSDDLLTLLTRAYVGPGDEMLYGRHGFLLYPINAKAVGATPVAAPEKNLTFDVDAVLKRVGPKTRAVFIANPNNPTGTYLPREVLRRLAKGLPPSVLLVIDAAYAEFVSRDDYEAGATLVDEFPNVAMTRTFSKIYALASLRLGWAYCAAETASVLNRLRNPFNVGTPAQEAGIAALADTAWFDRARKHNDTWRPWLERELEGLGFAVNPGAANFVLMKCGPDAKAADAADAVFRTHGVIARKVKAYGLPEYLRITVGIEAEMRAATAAARAFAHARETAS
jgi:histidinol-phosphate aminotransferase